MFVRIGIVIAIATCLPLAAKAQTLLLDNFDDYLNQASFNAAWPVVGTQPNGTLSPMQSVSSPNSIFVPGSTVNTAAPRNERTFAETGNQSASNIIRFSFDFYDSDSNASPSRNYANIQDAPGTASGQLISLGLNNNLLSNWDGGNYYMARILGYTPTFKPQLDPQLPAQPAGTSGAYFKLNDGPASTLRSTGWHNLSVDISDTEYKFYVDNTLSKTISYTPPTPRSFDSVRLGSGLSNSATPAYFDNVKVVVNPTTTVANNADFDEDGRVDGADVLIWQTGLGIADGTAIHLNGDANADGNVLASDLAVWRSQFNTSPGSGRANDASSLAKALASTNVATGTLVSSVQLSLNLRYNDPADPSEGGIWHLVAKSSGGNGIAGISAIISQIDANSVAYGTQVGNGYPAVTAGDINADLNAGNPYIIGGAAAQIVYFQDTSAAGVITGVGEGAGTPGDVTVDPLGQTTWNDSAVIASGGFGSARPSFAAGGTRSNALATTSAPFNNAIASTVTTVQRGDSLVTLGLEAPGLGLSAGDANRDHSVRVEDYSIWHENLGTGTTWDQGDFNDDGLVNSADLNLLLTSAGRPGDFNFNGEVDAADYLMWRKGLGITFTQGDYDIWRTHFGQTAGSGSGQSFVTVPEPTSLLLLLLGVGIFCSRFSTAVRRDRGGERHSE